MQKKLSEYKSRSVLSSFEESTKLLANVEQLRNQQAEILAKGQEANNRLRQLIAIAGSPPGQTSDTSVLQSERVFRQNLVYYTETSAKLANLLSKFAANHPEVIAEKVKQQKIKSALLSRSRLLLGRAIDIKTLEGLSLNVHNPTSWKSRESAFQEIKQVRIERQRLRNKAEEIDQQIAQFESQFAELAEQELRLNSSQLDVKVADAVFASTVANSSDVSKSNADYLPQMLVKHSLAEETISPNVKLILLAALTQSQQWFTKTTRMATLVMLLGLTGGSWVTNELLIPQIAQAETARIDLSVTSKPNETYETLVNRAETAVQAAVQEKFDQNKKISNVTVMVMGENYGATAPLLSLEVSRNQWHKSPDIEIWSTYFANARSLLGLNSEVATTTSSTPATATAVIAEQPVNSYVSSLETINFAPTPNQTTTPSNASNPVSVADVGSNRQLESSSVTDKTTTPPTANPETVLLNLAVTSKPSETYETLLSRAEAEVQAAVEEKFDQNKHLTNVTVMVMAENYGATAPVLSLEVSRNQWHKSPDIQRWGTYFASARSLLGFNDEVASTTSTTPKTDSAVIAKQPVNSYVSRLETVNLAPTPNQTTPSKASNPVSVATLSSNLEPEFSSVINKTTAPQTSNPEAASIDLWVTRQLDETYETLLSRAEAEVQATVEENFDQNKKISNVTVMVMAENYGSTAPVLSLEVSRNQWRKSPDIQRWGTYLMSARSLLGFNTVATTTSDPAIDSVDPASQSEIDNTNIDSLDNSNSSDPATDSVDPAAQPETNNANIDSLDNSNSSNPGTTTPVPSQQPANSTTPNPALPTSIELVN